MPVVVAALLAIDLGVLVWFVRRSRPAARIDPRDLLKLPSLAGSAEDSRAAMPWLVAVTLLALALRLISLDSDLWLDEILTVARVREQSVWQAVTTFPSTNNHLLNSLLVKASFTAFGETAWAARLPAVLFGVASVPALYWAGRQVFSAAASRNAALLLAVSYHHIFFSQNARGYTAYVLFALVSSSLFVRALQEDRPRQWTGYIAAMTLGFASLATTAFVLAAHAVVAALALRQIGGRGGAPRRLAARVTGAGAAVAWIGLHAYVVVLPGLVEALTTTYVRSRSGYRLFSTDFMQEILRGLGAGSGVGLIGIAPLSALACVGLWQLRRRWPLLTALALPGLLHVTVATAAGLIVHPRDLLLGLPVVLLVAARAIEVVAVWFAGWNRDRLATTTVAVAATVALAIVSVLALPHYYATPKQPFRGTLDYLEASRQPGEPVGVTRAGLAGITYYGRQRGLEQGRDFVAVLTVPELDALEAGAGDAWLVVANSRSLRLSTPELFARVEAGWEVAARLEGTIGGGDVTIWRPRR